MANELNNYLDELNETILNTNDELLHKSEEIVELYRSIVSPEDVPALTSVASSKTTVPPEKVPNKKTMLNMVKNFARPKADFSKQLNSAKKFVGIKDTNIQTINKEIKTVLKDDTNIDINIGVYPELKLNEIMCNKIKEQPDESKKLNSYIYYFFYILMKYIIKQIVDTKSITPILKNNNNKLKEYIDYDFNLTSANYTTIKDKFTNIYDFIFKFLEYDDKTLNSKTEEIEENYKALLDKIQKFTFT